MASGEINTGVINLSSTPTEDIHGVPLWFVRKLWAGGLEGIDIGPGTLFPSVRNTVESKAVYLDEQGFLSPATNAELGGGERALGYVRAGRLYLNGMFVKGLSGLQVGKAYWIQGDGTVGPTPVSQEGLWSVRLGLAISDSAMHISIHISGGV